MNTTAMRVATDLEGREWRCVEYTGGYLMRDGEREVHVAAASDPGEVEATIYDPTGGRPEKHWLPEHLAAQFIDNVA